MVFRHEVFVEPSLLQLGHFQQEHGHYQNVDHQWRFLSCRVYQEWPYKQLSIIIGYAVEILTLAENPSVFVSRIKAVKLLPPFDVGSVFA